MTSMAINKQYKQFNYIVRKVKNVIQEKRRKMSKSKFTQSMIITELFKRPKLINWWSSGIRTFSWFFFLLKFIGEIIRLLFVIIINWN